MSMSPTEVVSGKAYWSIRFSDIPQWWVLGVSCLCCGHEGEIDRFELERRFGKKSHITDADKHLKCSKCKNGFYNRFVIIGKMPR